MKGSRVWSKILSQLLIYEYFLVDFLQSFAQILIEIQLKYAVN